MDGGMKMKKGLLALLILCCLAGTASASYIVTSIILGADSVYTAGSDPDNGTGEIVWSGTDLTDITYVDGTTVPIILDATLTMTFSDGYDLSSSSSTAKAEFLTGNWDLTLESGGMQIAYFEGVLQRKYIELATEGTNGESLVGGAVAKITHQNIINSTYFEGFDVSDGTPFIGIKGFTSFNAGEGIQDYQGDWDADNLIIEIVADETGIPEPMTLGLVGLGAVFLRRKA